LSLSNSYDPQTGITTGLILGTRSTVYDAYSGTTYQGAIVDINLVDTARKYQMIQQIGVGKRVPWFTNDSIWDATNVQGIREKPALVGASEFGIGYKQTIVVADNNRIRRWPRDWHGENMK
jgi:hypothetical protein